MINKLANSIVKKNISPFQCIGFMHNMKLAQLFSNNNKKNPFQKFKRSNKGTTDINDGKAKKNQESKQSQQKQQRLNTSNNFQRQNQVNNKINKPLTGFNKFKRHENEELHTNNKKQQNKDDKNQQKNNLNQMKKQNIEQQQQFKKEQTKVNSQETTKIKENQSLKVKGFSKFKKVQTINPINSAKSQKPQNLNSQTEKNIKKSQESNNEPKKEAQLNTKSELDVERQNAYKNTQNKIQQDKEEWQGFLQDQIKKQKQQKVKKQAPDWKNFDFTSRKNNQDKKSHQDTGRSNPFQLPKSPFEVMRLVFFAGIGLYLGTLLVTQLLFIDSSKLIQNDQMINLLKAGKIRQTWFLTTVQSLSQQSSRTKKYACATLDDSTIVKCQSNNDFQQQWLKLVDQFDNQAVLNGVGFRIMKKAPIVKKDTHIFNSVRSILSFALLIMFLKSIMSGVSKGKGQMGKGGGLSGLFDNTKSHRFRQTINVKFEDVVGMNKAKQEIVQFIDFLKNHQKYNKLGAKIPRGALLTGPPGTGKTMLAKACAGQSGVPFFTISGSEFMEMYVGVGAQRVRNLFAQAKEAAPSIIFIDEIDAVGKKRASGSGGGGNDERDNTLNQLLVQMDGFDQTNNVIVFAATNQKEVLDPALTRPGRFDRLIQVELPDIQGRKQIFMVHLKPIVLDQKFAPQQYAKRLATLTPGFSGADIKNLCNQAAIIAARNQKKSVSVIDFEMASQRIIGGVEKKSSLITPQTKKTVAYHQCGHGVVSWFMEHASPLLKLTIIPRSKGALGYAQYLPNENNVYSRKQLQDQICVILGGRIAEEIFFKKISTGASDDLQKAHKVAKAIIAEYGMGKNLSWLSYGETEYAKQYSHQTQQKIDQEILEIIFQCSVKTRQIVESKREKIQKLAQMLLKQQTIDQRMIQSVLGQRPFKSSKQYQDYIRQKKKMEEQQVKKQQEPSITGGVAFKSLQLLKSMVESKKSEKVKALQHI